MDTYYELKKRQGYVFSSQDIAPNLSCDSIGKRPDNPIEMPEGVSYWSHLSGRYRNAEEQRAFVNLGMLDQRLSPRKVSTLT